MWMSLGSIILPTTKSKGECGETRSLSLLGTIYILLGVTYILKWYDRFYENDTFSVKTNKRKRKRYISPKSLSPHIAIVDILVNLILETSLHMCASIDIRR